MEAAIDPPRARRRLLGNPDYLRLWIAGALGNAMRWLEMLVAALFTYETTRSALAVAVVTVARTLPMLLAGAVFGAIAEAVDRKRLLVAGFCVMTLCSATLWLLAASGAIALWHIAALGVVAGAVWATEMAVRRRMIGEVVEPPLLGRAIALDTVTGHLTRMAGPLLGGIAFQTLGLEGAYLGSAVLIAAAATIVAFVRHDQARQPLRLGRLPADIASGLAFARQHAILLQVVLITVVTNFFGFCYSALVAPLAIREYGASPVLVGLLAAAEPLGAALSALCLAAGLLKEPHPRLMMRGSLAFLGAVVLASHAPWYVLCWALLFAGGLGTAAFSTMQSTLVLTHTPPAMRSRVMGIITVGIGTGPLGVLLVGALSEGLGTRGAMLAMAAAGLAALTLVRRRAATR